MKEPLSCTHQTYVRDYWGGVTYWTRRLVSLVMTRSRGTDDAWRHGCGCGCCTGMDGLLSEKPVHCSLRSVVHQSLIDPWTTSCSFSRSLEQQSRSQAFSLNRTIFWKHYWPSARRRRLTSSSSIHSYLSSWATVDDLNRITYRPKPCVKSMSVIYELDLG